MIVDYGARNLIRKHAAKLAKIRRRVRRDLDDNQPRNGQLARARSRCQARAPAISSILLWSMAAPQRCPEIARAIATARSTLVSRSRPGAGMIWIVISREMSDCHSPAAFVTRITAPVVNDTRNVMIATTATRARPEIELRGTSAVSKPRQWARSARATASSNRCVRHVIASLSRKYAAGRRAAPDGGHRTGPSARCRASR